MGSTAPSGDIETDVLVVGAGPAGASLAAFLARYGCTGHLISSAPGTADTPRAHITNLSALDALRDLGIADECYRLGNMGEHTRHYRWCETLAEEEYGRMYAWGNDPKRRGDYEAASPNPGVLDLPQQLLEPLLVRTATAYGFKVQFNTHLLSFVEDATSKKITALVKDRLRNVDYHITCKYLFGADGGRSVVAKQLDLPFNVLPMNGIGYNILVKSEIGHLMQNRQGNLHWNTRVKRNDPWLIVTRMVKPWNEWLISALSKNPVEDPEAYTAEQWIEVWKDLIGDSDAEVEVLSMSKWNINEVCAETFSKGNAFCLGDAVHRHPPVNGLGSNTCIGDAFNLAWKANLVLKGLASPSLLETYTAERQPVGAEVVRVANRHLREHVKVWQLLGVQPPRPDLTMEERLAGLTLLKEDSEKGRQTRKRFRDQCRFFEHETHALGLEMGQKYTSSAVYETDEPEAWTRPGREAQDPILHYDPCAFPGRRLPHAWLSQDPPTRMISTLDLAGGGQFSLLTGFGGEKWKVATKEVSKEMKMPIKVASIGPGQDWRDTYWDWSLRSGVEESGAVLVRPDLFVAWRAERCLETEEQCTVKLREVMRSVLGL